MTIGWVGTYVPDFSRNRRLAEYLARAGFDVRVTRVHLWPEDRVEAFSDRRLRIVLKALAVYPVLFFKLLFQGAPDAYLVSYPGWLDMPVVKFVAIIKRRPVVFDIFISLYDTAVSDRGLANPASAVAGVARFVDRLALRLADIVIADCPAHGRFFSALAERPLPLEVLFLGANEEVFYPKKGLDPVPERILFYGTYVPLQGAEWIVRSADLLEVRGIQAELIMVGNGQDRQRVEALSRSLSGNVVFRDSMTQDQLVEQMHRAAVVLGVFGTSDKAQRVVPHKVYEAMACGRPVLTGDSEAIRDAFTDAEIAVSPPGDAEALADALAELLADPGRTAELGVAARAAFEDRYSGAVQAERLSRIFRSATTSSDAKSATAAG